MLGGGAISVIYSSQVSLQVHYCKRDEVHVTHRCRSRQIFGGWRIFARIFQITLYGVLARQVDWRAVFPNEKHEFSAGWQLFFCESSVFIMSAMPRVPMLYTRQCNMFWAIVSLTAKVCYWIVNVFNFSDFLSISQYLDQCSSTFLSSWNPWYTFAFFVEPPSTKIKKTWITCQKIKYFVVKHSTNQHLLKILKSKKFNDSIDCSCISGMYLLHSEFGKKKNMLFCFIWLD